MANESPKARLKGLVRGKIFNALKPSNLALAVV